MRIDASESAHLYFQQIAIYIVMARFPLVALSCPDGWEDKGGPCAIQARGNYILVLYQCFGT